MRTAAIVQSNYIPWKGYFDLIAAADVFILYDDMQYTRRDWRNRNLIKTPQGLAWLTIPVLVRGRYHQKINETGIEDPSWATQHWRTLESNYARAPFFEDMAQWLRPLYLEQPYSRLSEVNRAFLEAICRYLGITTTLIDSSSFQMVDGKSERLADLCLQAGCDRYVSGQAARDYIVPEAFSEKGIELSWFDYEGYRPYSQLWGEFVHGVSILDLLFNCGPEARTYLRYARP